MAFYKKLASRWQKLTLVEQLANIGSEISQARHAEEVGNSKDKKAALERALELVYLTLADKRWRSRLKEIARLKEVICDIYQNAGFYNVSLKALEDYCLPFALVARRHI